MRDEITDLLEWERRGVPYALATVIGTSRSAPRPPGAVLAMGEDGRVVGNVSGGCVEPAVVELAREVLEQGGSRRARFGYSDSQALDVGLSCGGEVDIFIRRVDGSRLPLEALAAALASDVPVAVVTIIEAPDQTEIVGHSLVVTDRESHGRLLGSELGRALEVEARSSLRAGGVSLRELGSSGERMQDDVTVAIESFSERPRLIVFGAIDYAAAVAAMGRFLGFHVTVCDARAAFATPERFPDADDVIVEWPHRYLERTRLDETSALCVLTHDPKFDIPAIVAALQTPVGYLGVMGSRRTHEDRLRRLRAAGVPEHDLARLRSPVGLDLGGRSPQETAVAIAAEIVMVRNRASGQPLRERQGAIHRRDGVNSVDDR